MPMFGQVETMKPGDRIPENSEVSLTARWAIKDKISFLGYEYVRSMYT
jgi:hypothetical protein